MRGAYRSTEGGRPGRRPGLRGPQCSDGSDVRGLRALLALPQVVLDLLGLIEVAVPISGDRAEVHEHICAAVVRSDEAETLLRAEPLHGSCCHCDPSFLVALRASSAPGAPGVTC